MKLCSSSTQCSNKLTC